MRSRDHVTCQPMQDEDLKSAHAHHVAGRLGEAEQLYRAVLNRESNHPDALHLLGLALVQGGRAAEGATEIQKAIALRPNVSVYHANMGFALATLGHPEVAIRAYRKAAAL